MLKRSRGYNMQERFNASLVNRQLVNVLPESEDVNVDVVVERIRQAWERTNAVVEIRPRWLKHSLAGGQTMLMSTFSGSYGNNQAFEQINFVNRGDVHFACPIPKLVLEKIGPWKVSKILIRGGLPYLFEVIKRHEDYQEMMVNESVIAFVNEFLKDLDSDLEEM